MIHLQLLGSIDLRDPDGRELRTVLAQPKRLALLAYLGAASPTGPRRRDTLLTLFWPEHDQEHARNALSQALTFLRRALGEDAIVSRSSDELALDEATVRVDVRAFRKALEEEQLDEALKLYQGELLPAFFLSQAPGFEEWLERERAQLRFRAAAAAESLAKRHESTGHMTLAVDCARRAVELSNGDERPLRRLIELLDRLGDRAGALRTYEEFARRLATELQVEPAPETVSLIERIRSAPSGAQPAKPVVVIPTERAAALPGSRESREGVDRRRRTTTSLALLTVLLLMLGVTLSRWGRSAASSFDRDVVAVVPFRVTGADSSLWFLREGMLDLLASKLSGTKELRTVDPRTLLRGWHQAGGSEKSDIDRNGALELARQLGAGRLVEGEVIGTPERLILNASLTEVGPERQVRATVAGPSDSLTFLVDRLAAQLLALGAGEAAHRLAGLTTASLPALRAYLDGRAAYRRGAYTAARTYFDQAMELDSSFALAGLSRRLVAGWLAEPADGPGARLAWRHRNRLSPRDLLLLTANLGPRFPFIVNLKEQVSRIEALVASAPDDPEAWESLADAFYHYGPLLGIPDTHKRSLQAIGRALALDSSFAPALAHRHELYYEIGDTSAAREALAFYLRLTPRTAPAAVARWFARTALNDTTLGDISLTDDSLLSRPNPLVNRAVLYGIGLVDAESVLTLRRTKVSSDAELAALQDLWWNFCLIRGQPQRAAAAIPLFSSPARRTAAILSAALGDGDSMLGARFAAQVPRTFVQPRATLDEQTLELQYAAVQHDLARGRLRSGRDAVAAWRDVSTAKDTSWPHYIAAHYALLLDAQVAALTQRADAKARLAELDSALLVGPEISWFTEVGNIIVARLWHARGDPVRALATVRRRVAGLAVTPLYPTSLRDEGRYASHIGDREGTIRAYRHYLMLRSDPEPSTRPRVEEVRAELAALEVQSPDR